MGKVIIFVAICLALLFISVRGSSFGTTTITMSENPREQMSQRCQQEIQRAQNLRSCEEYLRQSTKFTEEEEILTVMDQDGDWRQSFPRCCEQLEQMEDEECRCEGIKQVVQQEQQRGELQGREMREALKTAQQLPALCRISPQQCQNIPAARSFF